MDAAEIASGFDAATRGETEFVRVRSARACPTVDCAAGCPSTARLRPSDGWAYRETLQHVLPPANAEERWLREFRTCRARKRATIVGGIGLVGVAIWGLTWWEWGDVSFSWANEGSGLGNVEEHGNLDKLGHFTAAYIATSGLAAIFRKWGLSRRESALRGAVTALACWTAIEIGDAFAEYGFSPQDLAADVLGCIAGYLHETNPWIHRTFDVRWQYWPSGEGGSTGDDPSSDYEGTAIVLALNTGALVSRRPNAFDMVDLQIGYQARGYETDDPDKERWVFVGIGLNLANLLRRVGFPYAAFFDYYQVPFLSINFGYELNDGETGLLYGG